MTMTAELPETVTPPYSPAIRAAFAAWLDHRAYVDNGGNYRLRPEPATPTHHPRGKIAPWNREVKRLFASSAEFHAAAHGYATGGNYDNPNHSQGANE